MNISSTRKKIIKKKVKKKISSRSTSHQLNAYFDPSQNFENKISIEEKNNVMIGDTKTNTPNFNN